MSQDLTADIDLFDADRLRLAPVTEWCRSLRGRMMSPEQICVEADDRFADAGFVVSISAIADTGTTPTTYYPVFRITGRVAPQEMDHERRAEEYRRSIGVDPGGLRDPGKSAIEISEPHRH